MRLIFLAAVGAEDVATVGHEPSTDERLGTLLAPEAVVVPLSAVEVDELRIVDPFQNFNACDWILASVALLGVQAAVALDAVRLLLDGRVPLPTESLVAVCAQEAVPVPRTVLVYDSASGYHPFAFCTVLPELAFVARHADDVMTTWYEAVCADQFVTDFAAETFGVPLPTFVFVLLHASAKDVATERASGGESTFVTRCAIELIVLVSERLFDERGQTSRTLETFVVPMSVLVRQVLVIARDRCLALVAHVGEQVFIALLAVRVLIMQNISLTTQADLAMQTRELTTLPVLL